MTNNEIREEAEKVWNFHRTHNNGVMAVSEAKKLFEKELAKKDEEIIKKIDDEIELSDDKAVKHCFKKGKMCEECWERKQPLLRLKSLLNQDEESGGIEK